MVFSIVNHPYGVPPWPWKPQSLDLRLKAHLLHPGLDLSMVITDSSGAFHGGSPKNSWMVYWLENPIYKWMITRATPMAMETPINIMYVNPKEIRGGFLKGKIHLETDDLEVPPF